MSDGVAEIGFKGGQAVVVSGRTRFGGGAHSGLGGGMDGGRGGRGVDGTETD